MKKYNRLYTIVSLVCTLGVVSACEEVIDLELKNTNPGIVIDAVIAGNQESFEVKITQSTGFYDLGNYKAIDNARVILTSLNGESDTLAYTGNGIYKGTTIRGKEGETYTLTVNALGNTYTAVNTIPYHTELDSVGYEWAENPHSKGYMINMYFTDAPGIDNYYRSKVLVDNILGRNQSEGPDYMLYEDKVFDGSRIQLPAIRGGKLLHESDTVTVELYGISKATFEYYNTVRNIIASGNSSQSMGRSMMDGSSAPANPITNFNNGALGYFGAYCVSRKTIILKPR